MKEGKAQARKTKGGPSSGARLNDSLRQREAGEPSIAVHTRSATEAKGDVPLTIKVE